MAREPGRYAQILVWVFHHRAHVDPDSGDLLFDQEDLRVGATELGVDARNFPDLTYYMRSRAKTLPREIADAGYTAIAQRGQGRYALISGENKIAIPSDTEVIPVSTAPIPQALRDLLRVDEQCILSVAQYLDIISDFVGIHSWHLQAHLRTTGSLKQQVEADDVWVAQDGDGTRFVLPIEAKGPGERLGRQQMISTVDAVRTKYPRLPVIPLAIQLEQGGLIALVRFSFEVDAEGKIAAIEPVQFRRYQLNPPLTFRPNRT